MSICMITGNHPRHKYLVNELITTGLVSCWVAESREEFVPSAPVGLDQKLSELFDFHFSERARIESEIFGAVKDPSLHVPTLTVEKDNLNSDRTIKFINDHSPSLVLSFGCHKISDNLIAQVNARFWNTHGGLSPEYRGVTTHFWPSYFLEPQMTGITLHETTDSLDAGGIILQTSAPMVRGDTLHRLAARNLEHYASELTSRLVSLDLSSLPEGIKQKKYGKVFMSADWRPEHLLIIYEIHNDKIVDYVLDGKIAGREPNLVSAI